MQPFNFFLLYMYTEEVMVWSHGKSVSVHSYICSFQEYSVLSGKKRKEKKKGIWHSLLYCEFFLLHQGRCAFPNLILSWGEGGRNQRNYYQVGGGDWGWGAGERNMGGGNVNQEAAALKLDTINYSNLLFILLIACSCTSFCLAWSQKAAQF